jgi:hypothetical protein
MRSEFDQEMDSLLREGARRWRAAPTRQGAAANERAEADAAGGLLRAMPYGAHLDADEQNAYAENSLPASARTHYAAHLADCDVCRRGVTQLALAAGMPAQLEQQATATAQGVLGNVNLPNVAVPNVTWRERLGALFAPRAWRYAVPALALLLVGAVALLVLLRERRSEVSIAEQRNTSGQAKPAQPDTHHAPQDNRAATVGGEGGTLSTANSNASVTKEEVAAGGREEQGQPKAGTVLSDDAAAPPPPASVSSGTATTGAPSDVAGMPVPAATPEPIFEATPIPVPEAVISSQETEKKTKALERADELAKDAQKQDNYENNSRREQISGPRRNSEQARNMQRGGSIAGRDNADKNDRASATPTPAPPAAPTASARSAARRREPEGERDARSSDEATESTMPKGMRLPKSTAETRTVAGRKFRRAGSAWIDTAYQSSQAVTVVRRNSEQYRALIADEPQLRRISDALGGEVTVVWKGRAYRIR